MVLGSSAVAFASPSSSDVSKAKKVFTDNGAKITAEYETNGGYKTVKATATVEGVEGTYGFSSFYGQGVKLDSKGNPLEYVGTDVTDLNTKKGTTPTDATTNPSAITSDAIAKVADVAGCVPNGAKVANVVKTTVADSDTYSLVISTLSSASGSTAATVEADDIAVTTNVYPTASPITVGSNGKLTADVDYMTTDGYSYALSTTITSDDLVEADSRVKSSDSSEVYWYRLQTITSSSLYVDDYANSVAMAIEEGTLTTSAAGVGIGVYQIYENADGVPFISSVSKPANDLTITLDCDILSNTSLKKTATSLYTVSSTYGTDAKLGAYRKVVALADNQNVDFSAAYQTFDISFNGLANTGTYGVLIFEQGENESFNDGVSDTDTTAATSATAATSPKTGDVAPIAALAVVMMGACGAMVVASKKRA
jgi:hypothetical protein